MGRKKRVFSGSACALITPFKNGKIDYVALDEMIDFQINNGTDAIVLLGTTGEASTIFESERSEIIPFAKEKIKGRVPLIVGTGSNCTEVAIRYTKSASAMGADACLVVTPYYNKATPSGLFEHFKQIAKASTVPIILYNVPSRTGVNIPMSVYDSLAKIDNIVGVKEASGKISYISELISRHSADFDIYSGCDELTLPSLALGAQGVISVVANITPSYMHQLCMELFHGNMEKSRQIQEYLNPLISELFLEVNPIPVKTAMYLMSMCKNEFRLPMCKSTRESEVKSILSSYGLV